MTDEAQRVTIAEACGWKRPDHPDAMKFKAGWSMPHQYWLCPEGVLRSSSLIPDYLRDLNAMHEAERVLRENPHWEYQYGDKLREITGNVGPRGGHFIPNGFGCFALAHATSRQRAEAFLKTVGKWDDKV